MNKEKLYTAIGVIFVWTILLAILYAGYYAVTSTPKSMDLFCESLGFEEATDFKDSGFCANDHYKTYFIECDKNKIYNVISEQTCKDYNKWGVCIWRSWDNYKITNGDCR